MRGAGSFLGGQQSLDSSVEGQTYVSQGELSERNICSERDQLQAAIAGRTCISDAKSARTEALVEID
jgi:hypothetical protein